MFLPPTEPANPADEAANYIASQQAERIEHCLQSLHQLIDLGMDVARVVLHQAQHHAMATIAGGKPGPDFTAAFERAARTVLMAQHVAKPQPGRVFRRTAARKPVIHAAEDAIQREAGDDGEANSPRAEQVERLDRLDQLHRLDGLDNWPGAHPRMRRAGRPGYAVRPGRNAAHCAPWHVPWHARQPAPPAATAGLGRRAANRPGRDGGAGTAAFQQRLTLPGQKQPRRGRRPAPSSIHPACQGLPGQRRSAVRLAWAFTADALRDRNMQDGIGDAW